MKQIISFAIIALLLQGCKTLKLVDSKTESKRDSITYSTFEKQKIFKPAVQADFSANLGNRIVFVHLKGDSSKRQPCVIINQTTRNFHSKDGSLDLQFKVDSLGNIVGNFQSKADSLVVELEHKHTLIKEQEKIIEQYKLEDTWFARTIKKLGGTLLWTIVGIIVAALFVLYLYNKFRPKLL